MDIHLLAIDCQRDFCDSSLPGALYVPKADLDMSRLASMVVRIGDKLSRIHATMDSHNEVDIAHPVFWVDSEGEHPAPFTIVSPEDVENGIWTTTEPTYLKRAKAYVQQLNSNGRYPLCIWPPHCIIGTSGWTIHEILAHSLSRWCRSQFKTIDYQFKGLNMFTEHYSALQADVVDYNDPSTKLNEGLVEAMHFADEIVVAGEARSHCVANSIKDLVNALGNKNASKFVLLEDAMNDVSGFEDLGDAFFEEMKQLGMRFSNTVDYLSQ